MSDQCETLNCTNKAEHKQLVTDRDGGCSPIWLCKQCHSAYLMGMNEAKRIYD